MNSFKIKATGKYVPKKIVYNKILEEENNLEKGYIYKRTGIEKRFYSNEETLEDLAVNAIKDMLAKYKDVNVYDIDMIIVASTSYTNIMPSLSFKIQKYFEIKDCICMDILAGCSGYINAIDVAQKYIETSCVKNAIVIGADILSRNNYEDINTKMLFGDGAGVIYFEKSDLPKKYFCKICSYEDRDNILSCNMNHDLYMKGKEVYRFATTKTIENLNEVLDIGNTKIEEVKFVIPHQSNIRIIEKISKKTNAKMYTNISEYGNIFCASIPIAIDELFSSKAICEKDKIILLGYGGGLNLGSILMEV